MRPHANTLLARNAREAGRAGAAVLVLVVGLGLAGCGEEPEQPADPRTRPSAAAPVEPTPISGIYDVSGTTVPVAGGDPRQIAGTVILRAEGNRYTATFKLDTTFPGTAEPLSADVIGSGSGRISGRMLAGSTKTQLVVSTVPGIDTEFAFIPRRVGARIVSSAVTEIAPDGSVVIELENRPAEGENYPPTRTRLTGVRVADASPRRPDVAADAEAR